MTLKRLVIVLGSMMIALLAVVMVRAENRRLHYRLSQQDLRLEALSMQLREKELELARLTSPRTIREQVARIRLQDASAAPPGDATTTSKKRP